VRTRALLLQGLTRFSDQDSWLGPHVKVLVFFTFNKDKISSCSRCREVRVEGQKAGSSEQFHSVLGSSDIRPKAGVEASYDRACIYILRARDRGSGQGSENAWVFLFLGSIHPRASLCSPLFS
jgi:hypothetical protein